MSALELQITNQGGHAGPPLRRQTMKDDLAALWEGATFLPSDQPSRSDLLLQRVQAARQAAFLAFALKLSFKEPEVYKETDFAGCFEAFKTLPSDERRQFAAYPPFAIWLQQSFKHSRSQQTELKTSLADFRRVMKTFAEGRQNHHSSVIAGTQIRVERFHVDPLIVKAAFPEYQFPTEPRQREFEEKVIYPQQFFLTMVTLALERIKAAWPEAYREFLKFVSLVIDMIDAGFTSYSACEHPGVIFVSTDNSPLVALEEFLVHELGHQILYQVMELDPLVTNESGRLYELPWSRQQRDFYGYFHAFYIYIFLVHYLKRVQGRSRREQERVTQRRAHIVQGLNQALPDFEAATDFTERGRHLFENLRAKVQELNVS